MNNTVGAELRRQHVESLRRPGAEVRTKEWSSFRERLTDARRKIVKLFLCLAFLGVVFNYRNEIAEFFTPAAKIVMVQVRHVGEKSKLKQALVAPDSDLADITR